VPRGAVSADALRAHCRTLIASYKVPNTIELRAKPLPKSGAGKMLERELRDAHRRDREAFVAGV
jgi:long-chain acyl-CoA synthetase